MSDDLEPCPFCGSDKVGIEGFVGATVVECYNCGAHGSQSENPSRATIAWNRRAALAAKTEASADKQIASYKTLVAALRSQLTNLQAESAKYDEAVRTLESERAANAILTEELDAIKAAPAMTVDPVVRAWEYETPMPDGSVFRGASCGRLTIGVGVTHDSVEYPLGRIVPAVQPVDEFRKFDSVLAGGLSMAQSNYLMKFMAYEQIADFFSDHADVRGAVAGILYSKYGVES